MGDATGRRGVSHRISAIDFAKGVLVVAMVVYHALNYLGYDTLPHDYMAFVPMSFTMLAGFLITQSHSESTRSVPAFRLASRASKLLIIFTMLNVGARAIWSRNHYGAELSVHGFVTNWFDVYITGQAKATAFPVLVPIGYTLLLAIAILAMRRRIPVLPVIVAAVLSGACVVLEHRGDLFYNLQFISAGALGLALGTIDLKKVNSAVDTRGLWAGLVIAYVAVLLLRLDNYLSQLFITIVSLTMLYAAGRRVKLDRWVARQVCLVGRYTLFSYIVQILMLQVAGAIDRTAGRFATAAALISAVTLLMWASVRIVEFARSRAVGFDRLYRIVFA